MGLDFGLFFMIMGLVFGGVLILAVTVKLVEVNRSRTWPSTNGKVIISDVKSKKKTLGDNEPRMVNVPHVVYEYKVGSRKYKAERISLGEQMGGDVAIILDRYPVGQEVMVYYNPSDPSDAVLERDLPPGFQQGITIALIIFVGGGLALLAIFTGGVDLLRKIVPGMSNPVVVLVLGGSGVFSLLLAWLEQRRVAAMQGWSRTKGEITESGVEAFYNNTDSDIQPYRKLYRSAIVYIYEVDGRKYTGDRVRATSLPAWSSPGYFKQLLQQYSKGNTVQVFYNPKDPAQAVLEPKAPTLIVLWSVGAFLIFLAAAAAGVI